MRIRADLHIHSCLSPCAADDMSPRNIVAMAKLKGLDVVAICDHNSALNLPPAIQAGQAYGICVVPALEVTSKEDTHLLCYFSELGQALEMGAIISACQHVVKNKPSVFGAQILVGMDDEPMGEVDRLLLAACSLSLEEISERARRLGGVMVPAHINRGANSILNILGFLPERPEMPTVEIDRAAPACAQGRLCLVSSDAHRLGDILEEGQPLFCRELTPKGIVETLMGGAGLQLRLERSGI